MRYWLIAILMAAVGAGGCRKGGAPAGSAAAPGDAVAVVNMMQVFKDVGWIDQMEVEITTLNDRSLDQVAEAQRSYDAASHKVEAEFTPHSDGKLTAEQQQAIAALAAYGHRTVDQIRLAGQDAIAKYRQACLSQYRTAISPLVGDIAKAHKMSVVIDDSDTMLFHDPAVDLTAEVSAAARQNVPVLTPVALPKFLSATPLAMPATPQTAPSTAP